MGHKQHEPGRRDGARQGAGHRPAEAAQALHGVYGALARNLRSGFHRREPRLACQQRDQGHQEGAGRSSHQGHQVY